MDIGHFADYDGDCVQNRSCQ